jgi:pimeloyl-ACP methyl ester carboxylesterase
MVAVEMARLQPTSVDALALVDGGWETMLEATRMLPMQLVEAMAEPPEVLASMEAWLADRRAFDPLSWDEDQETAARAQVVEKHAGHVGPMTKWSVVRRVVDSMYAYRPIEALAEVRCPVSILVADAPTADDEDERERLLALADVQRMRARAGLPETHVRRFAGAGHDLMRHRPDEVAAVIARLAGG